MRARPLEPLSVGQFQGGDKHTKKTKAPKISKKQHPFQEPEPDKKSHQKHHKKTTIIERPEEAEVGLVEEAQGALSKAEERYLKSVRKSMKRRMK